MKKNKTINISIHLVVWAIFILLPTVILPIPSEYILKNNSQLVTYFILTIFSIAFFYFNYYYILPKLYFRKNYLVFILAVLFFLVISFVLTDFITNLFEPDYSLQYNRSGFFRNYLVRFILIFAVSLVLSYRKRYKQIEDEKVKAELSTLKAQINPHFLFNTLNGIYGQAIIKSETTANSISKLSLLMRYVLTETNKETVSLEKEINYIENYIELQKIRLTKKTEVIFRIDGNTNEKKIAPMLLINFVENAFKHGVSNEFETNIDISISVKSNDFIFRIINDKVKKDKNLHSTKIGINNIIRRLNLIYNNRYSLDIQDNEEKFEINLKITNL